MKRKTLLLGLILTIGAIITALFLRNNIGKNGPKEIVNIYLPNQARKAAMVALSSFEPWKEPVVQEYYTFYDLNDTPSAYVFNVQDNYGKAGFIVVSATDKFDPIIEISESTSTPVTRALELAGKITEGTIYTKEDVKTKYIYLGGAGKYFVKLEFREGEELQQVFYDVSDTSSVEISKTDLIQKQSFYEKYFEDGAPQKWEILLQQP